MNKILTILCTLVLFGCTTVSVGYKTTTDLVHAGEEACKDVPTLDMGRTFCIYGYIASQCKLYNYDLRICGELEKR